MRIKQCFVDGSYYNLQTFRKPFGKWNQYRNLFHMRHSKQSITSRRLPENNFTIFWLIHISEQRDGSEFNIVCSTKNLILINNFQKKSFKAGIIFLIGSVPPPEVSVQCQTFVLFIFKSFQIVQITMHMNDHYLFISSLLLGSFTVFDIYQTCHAVKLRMNDNNPKKQILWALQTSTWKAHASNLILFNRFF